MQLVKKFINKFLKCFDGKLIKISKNPDFAILLVNFINCHKINYVLDIGANIGQFAISIRNAGYKKNILSFEPINQVYKKLIINSSKDELWNVYKRCCVGEKNKKVSLNISKNLVSSSIFKVNSLHIENEKNSESIRKIIVNMITLDSLINKKKNLLNYNMLLKLDVQGYELNVLKGIKKNIKNIAAILCEVSLDRLYFNQPLWLDLVSYLKKNNFIIWLVERGFSNYNTGRTLQLDILFVNKKFLN
jgi:FkbM family methyltransferase